MSTQLQRIRKHFIDGKALTPLQALGLYGTFRLAHHVWVLREKESLPINTRIKTDENGHQYAEYYLGKVRIEDPEALRPVDEEDLSEAHENNLAEVC